jgi:hypothetical protein
MLRPPGRPGALAAALWQSDGRRSERSREKGSGVSGTIERRVPSGLGALASVLAGVGGPDGALVFAADPDIGDDWQDVLAQFREAFEATRRALAAGAPVVYVVDQRDLLGQRGPGAAMAATGLLSGARAAAFEMRKAGIPVNVVATEEATPPAAVAAWVALLLEPGPGGPTGELVRLGGEHLGKALP